MKDIEPFSKETVVFREKLIKYASENNIDMELVSYKNTVSNTALSVSTSGWDIDKVVKTILAKDKKGKLFAVIIGGKYRVDLSRIRKRYDTSRLSLLSADEVILRSGFPAGGVPPFGFDAEFCLDTSLLEQNVVMAGGGDTLSLMKIRVSEIIRAVSPDIFDTKLSEPIIKD